MTQKSQNFLYKELTGKIIGAAFEVYKNLGYGFLEKVYKNALLVELKVEKEYNSKNEFQLLNYLKATNVKVGLLLIFGEKKCEVKRMVY
ncbi:MAG: GxxExxY protein [bacterium]|nr:GxxExxY protein [bacterium]